MIQVAQLQGLPRGAVEVIRTPRLEVKASGLEIWKTEVALRGKI